MMLLIWAMNARAENSLNFSGYLKELWQYSHSAFDDRPYFLNTDRARLTVDGRYDILRAHIDYDQEVYSGSYFRTFEAKTFGLGEAPTWLNMDRAIDSNATALWRQRLYRGWGGLEDSQGTLRFGRQRISWGTGKLWNPTDVLNPYQPLSVEREERRGVDALYGRYSLGELSQAELAYAPQDRFYQQSILSRIKSNAGGMDFSFMGGKVGISTGSWMAGGDFDRNFFEGTLHGEWSYTEAEIRTSYWKADLGYDYTFASDTKIPGLKDTALVVEYFHNGAGTTNRAHYNPAAILSGREVALAQDYGGLTLSKDLTPLLKLDIVLLQNLNDGSQFFNPSLQWNALNNLYLTAAWQFFGGVKTTELGRAANLTYLQAQYFF